MADLVKINGYTFETLESNEIRKIYNLVEKYVPYNDVDKIIDYMEKLGIEREKLIQFARQTAKVFTEDLKIERL